MKAMTKSLLQLILATALFAFVVAKIATVEAGAPSPGTDASLTPSSVPFYIYLLLGLAFVLFSALGLGLMRKKSFLS